MILDDSELKKTYDQAYDLICGESEENDTEGAKQMLVLAEQGYAPAMRVCGHCYMNGWGVAHDEEKAFYWYNAAAEAGDEEGQYNLGMCYFFGEGTEQDPNAAFNWMYKAAESGNTAAQLFVGMMYANGDGTDQNDEKAFYWIKKAAEAGNVVAQGKLGVYYLQGVGTEENEEEGFKYLKAAADAGDIQSMYNIGVCLLNGLGTSVDYEKAANFLFSAAEAGEKDAMEYVVDRIDILKDYLVQYAQRNDLPEDAQEQFKVAFEDYKEDPDKAIEVFARLGSQGHSDSRNMMATHFYSHFDPPEMKSMNYWLLLQAASGEKKAMDILAVHYSLGAGIEKNEEEAFQLKKRNYELHPDDPDVKMTLALAYIDGQGGHRDFEKGVRMLKETAESGYPTAQERYGFLLLHIKHDSRQALYWLERALSNGYAPAEKSIGLARQEVAKADRRIALNERKIQLENEYANLRGLFTGKRRREIEEAIYSINKQLEELNR